MRIPLPIHDRGSIPANNARLVGKRGKSFVRWSIERTGLKKCQGQLAFGIQIV